MRLLVIDAYPRAGREALRDAGGTEAGLLYAALLAGLHSDVEADIIHPADGPIAWPCGRGLSDYAGVVWTGSSLTIHEAEDERVRAQIELGRAIRRHEIRSFGSCWAAQVAAVVAGGECRANPRGREFGIARRIELGPEARAHPMYSGKPSHFDALTSHADHITSTGAARCLASNAWSPVQAVSVDEPTDHFWAVQYHPEYDLHEVASLARLRRTELIDQGTFADEAAADAFIADAEALHDDPSRVDLRERLDVDETVLDPATRTREVSNWLTSLPEAG